MGSLLKMAWRNLGRNRRRTLITGLALAVGVGLCVATYGLMDGMNVGILRALTRLDLGHVQAHHPDYPRKKTLRLTIKEPEKIVAAARTQQALAGVTLRAYGFGLVSHGPKSAGVQLVGIDPKSEPDVTQMHKHLRQGKYLDEAPTPWPKGRILSSDEQALDDKLTDDAEAQALAEIEGMSGLEGGAHEAAAEGGAPSEVDKQRKTQELAGALDPPPERPPRVFIGVDLARILKAKVGDKLFVMSQTVKGLSSEVFLQISGVIQTGTSLYDRGRVYLHIKDLQRFLHLDHRVHEVAMVATSSRLSGQLSSGLMAALGVPAAKAAPSGRGAGAYLVRAWDEIRPDIKSIIQLNEVSTGIMVFIIYIVASLGVLNTMLMAVFERTRELGMLKAIGMSGGKVVWLIVAETLLLVLGASVVGTGVGLGLDLYMIVYGFDLTSMMSEGISVGGVGMDPVMYAAITPQGVITPTVMLGVICFLAALYPASRAARMRPAQGMREA